MRSMPCSLTLCCTQSHCMHAEVRMHAGCRYLAVQGCMHQQPLACACIGSRGAYRRSQGPRSCRSRAGAAGA
jgi:hypothetical protein